MARKIDFISQLSEQTARDIVKNGEEWKRYLNTASRLYKYPFQEQMLIFAQRPDATACASIEIWNEKMNCWVNKGAKGIALIDEDAPRPRLKYVFDVSDVHKARRIGRDPYLWQMREEHEEVILKRLEKTYGATNTEMSFADRLLAIAEQIAFDTYEEIAEDMTYLVEGSFLEGLDKYSMKVHLRDTLQASISYTLLTRCGLDVESYMDELDFEHIHEFNTLPVLAQLGTNTTELCKPVLMEIGRAIRAYDREIFEKGLANVTEPRYNALKRESEEREDETTEPIQETEHFIDGEKHEEEENDEYGIDVSEERRLLHPEYPDGRTAGDNPYKVRIDEEELSEGTQEGDLFGDAAVGQADEPPAGDSGDSRGANGTSHESDGESRGSERGTEREGSDALDTADEQHPARSGGDNPDRTDLQLNTEEMEKSDSQELPDFFAFLNNRGEESTENILRGLLCFDDYLKEKRKDIAAFFITEPDAEKRMDFIKKAYNKDYSEFDVGTHRVGYKAKEDGLVIWTGNYLTRSCEARISWHLVWELIDDYLAENIYLMPGETIDRPKMGIETGEYQQLSFFPSMEEQIGNIAIDHADEKMLVPTNPLISEQMIDNALITGGGQRDTRARIFAKYQKGLEPDIMSEFLKQEYGRGGKGFTFEGEPYCIWYDENGMKFAQGTAARYESAYTLSWSEVEERTFDLIDDGQYMDEAEMWHVPMQEKQELASKIYFFFRDEYGTMPPEVATKIYGYPDAEKEIMEHLSTPEGITQILTQMDQAIEEINNGEVTPRFRLIYKPEDIRQSVEELKREPVPFPAATDLEIPVETFITQDEIDYKLSRGSSVSEGLFRIYDYFLEGHSKKELADFLKQEYGTGGSAPALIGAWHSYADYDAKGLKLSKGSIMEPSAKILLTWTKVAERIQKLIAMDRFMTPQTKEEYAQWKVKREQKALEKAQKELKVDAQSEEIAIADEVFSSLKMEDMIASWSQENDCIQVDDGAGNNWLGSEFYDFMLNEAIVLWDDGQSSPISDDTLTQFQNYACENGWHSLLLGEHIQSEDVEYEVINVSGIRDNDKVLLKNVLNGQEIEKTVGFVEALQQEPEKDTRLAVAIENTEDYADPSIGFFTYHYQDGREGIRYRLVTIGEDGRLEAYPEANKFFINEAACKEYITDHAEELRVISYDEIVHQAGQNLQQQTKVEDISEPEDTVEEAEETEQSEEISQTQESGQTEVSGQEAVEGQTEEGIDLLEPDLNVPEVKAAHEPEIDTSHAVNYRITNDALTAGNAQEKFDRNIAAIMTLQLIENEKRTATPEEQNILAGYVGWGGLSEAFDERNNAWHDRYLTLKGLLNEQEYSAARESTLTAHYTSPVVIRSIYEALGNMGFEKGNVLEPSMGTGNFFGMLPEAMAQSRLYGVELDSLTGRIAKQLYPKARIQVTGFEKTDYPDDFFDVAVGNVPFGDYKVFDRKYDKYNLLIHDYFFAKSIDKVRQGGVVAMITSNGISGGTFDKRDSRTRRYIAQRCDLLGAIRLPRGTFEDTNLTTDILFFQKREKQRDLINEEPDWVQTTVVHESDFTKPDGEVVKNRLYTNNYFLEHPEMVLGKQEVISGPFGPQLVCMPTGESLEARLKEAVRHIQGSIESVGLDELEDELERTTIPADPDVKNYSYTVVDGEVYYREDSVMKPVEMSDSMRERIKGMVVIRNATNDVINYQLEEYGESAIKEKQAELSNLYDDFTKKFGLISSQTNKRAFNQDSSYCLLCSLEVLNEDGTLKRKADMFTKRTIKRQETITSVDTPTEALAVSMSEKACVDIGYMAELLGGSDNYDRIVTELSGVIFKNPLSDLEDPYAGWETGDEYLSGNVREKLEIARLCAENHPEYTANVIALERVQPKLLDASEIEVRLGATWVDSRYIDDFMQEVFETPRGKLDKGTIGTQYSEISGQWNIRGKSADFGNPLTEATYGTGRANAYKILEDSLNLRDSRIFDTVMEDGKEKRVLNKKETMLVSQKQEAIREAYKDWVFRDVERREVLCKKYNELFNSNRPREYDGSHLTFPGMSPNVDMRPHQKNAVAHQLYGNNTLLAHCVGAGKTYEMAAAAMESKRLGLAQKSLFVVPNYLTGQWASEFLTLYPGANILAATKKDFEPANRKKFCSRIATGDYDAVIIGHSQFEKIPLSRERQAAMIERQVSDITLEIESLKASHGERYTIKQMEKTKKSLLARLERLNDNSRKDDVVTFEQLGVDRLFVDESHSYKNLFLYTKMRNVAGIAQTEAQKSSDMFAKCQYMDELTGGKGITFATGTPISNSMTELYTNMRYLQYGTLQRLGLGHFDSWAASFGETITAIELAPEGTGYRAKTRFAKFFNLPELISIFKETADIQTSDMLNLPVPKAIHENVVLKPSEFQQDMVRSLADRAEDVRNGNVEATIDNMLKITNDGRKLALDQRLIDALLPDESESKVGACVERAVKLWTDTAEKKSAQLIFCDLSTPKNDGTFNVYHDIRDKLVAKGVPPEEIAFIHDANTELRKAELFAKVRSGQVRFLLGSTAKMGAGMNVQDRLIAEHHLDVPWRPSDIEQREGRIIRRGNKNKNVHIFRYVTEGTFDSYSWQLIENKQKFISQIMTSKSPVRSCEDVDEASLSYAEVKALATGNPYIKEKMDLDIQVSKLKLLKANHTSQIYRMEDNIAKHYPKKIGLLKERIAAYQIDVEHYKEVKPEDKEIFAMKLGERTYTDKKEAGTALIAFCRQVKTPGVAAPIGEYLGYKMSVEYDTFYHKFTLNLKGALTHSIEVGADALGNLTRINNALEGMEGKLLQEQEALANTEKQLANAKEEVTKPFPQEAELQEKMERLNELNALLNMDEKSDSASLEEPEEEVRVAERMVSEKRPSIMDKLVMFKEQSSKNVPEPMKPKDKTEEL